MTPPDSPDHSASFLVGSLLSAESILGNEKFTVFSPEQRTSWIGRLLDAITDTGTNPQGNLSPGAQQVVTKVDEIFTCIVSGLKVERFYPADITWTGLHGIEVFGKPTEMRLFVPTIDARELGNLVFFLAVVYLRMRRIELQMKVDRPLAIEHRCSTLSPETIMLDSQAVRNLAESACDLRSESFDTNEIFTFDNNILDFIKSKLKPEKEKLEKLLADRIDTITKVLEIIHDKVTQLPTISNVKPDEVLRIESVKVKTAVHKELKLCTSLGVVEKSDLLENLHLFDVYVKVAALLSKLVEKARLDVPKYSSNGELLFLSRCLAAGCTNQKPYAWSHCGGNSLKSLELEPTYQLMLQLPDGRITCSFCRANQEPKPATKWEFSCRWHTNNYIPPSSNTQSN